MAVQYVNGVLNLKKFASYLKKQTKNDVTIWTQRDGHFLFLTDRALLVKLIASSETPDGYTSEYACTMFKRGETPESYTPAHFVSGWHQFMDRFTTNSDMAQMLTPTNFLYEDITHTYRRFDTKDGAHVWIDRAMCDLFGVTSADLVGFLWEQEPDTQMIRVGARHGWCAFVMPAQNIER